MLPALDPRLAALFAVDQTVLPDPPVASGATTEQAHEYLGTLEQIFEPSLYSASAVEAQSNDVFRGVIKGEDGNDVELFFDFPPNSNVLQKKIGSFFQSNILSDSLVSDIETMNGVNCICFMHGGGMAICSSNTPSYSTFRGRLAATGLLVISVNYRNSSGRLGSYAYPAGLHDCYSALRWIHKQKSSSTGCLTAVKKVIAFGDSGGGNLSLSVCLLAKQRSELDILDGVYAMCPYISNLYAAARVTKDNSSHSISAAGEDTTLAVADIAEATSDEAISVEGEIKETIWIPPSLAEFSGYLGLGMLQAMAMVYDGPDSKDPIAWPHWSAVAAFQSPAGPSNPFQGLPPHTISVNELDPLRDEGIFYYRSLLHAGVKTRCLTIHGTTHAAEILYGPDTLPDVFNALLHDIVAMFESIR